MAVKNDLKERCYFVEVILKNQDLLEALNNIITQNQNLNYVSRSSWGRGFGTIEDHRDFSITRDLYGIDYTQINRI